MSKLTIDCITAYHGTNQYSYTQIQKSGFKIPKYSFTASPKPREKIPGDLGAGLYAFENSPEHAKKFIGKFHKEKDEVVVCQLQLEVDEKKVLNMNDAGNIQYFDDVRNSSDYKMLFKRFQMHVGTGKGRKCLDGLIIEYIIFKSRQPVDLVKKDTYTPFDDAQTSQFANGKEVCIRNEKIIKDYVAI